MDEMVRRLRDKAEAVAIEQTYDDGIVLALEQASDTLTRLTAALEDITAACEADCGGPTTDEFADDASVGGGADSEMALTFGMIRRARAALREVGRG